MDRVVTHSGVPDPGQPLDPTSLERLVGPFHDELVAFRRDLHAHPELGRAEVRTTRAVAERLKRAGLAPTTLPGGTGLVVDIGDRRPEFAIRADLDALPVQDQKAAHYSSTIPGVCHACGHDVHTTVALGAAIVLAQLWRSGRLRRPVRVIFQPAEELMPGGALDVIDAGAIEGIQRIIALHCDPRLPAGQIGVRVGPITGAADHVRVRLAGSGGHTARPHLTADLVFALATVATQLPATLSRRVDPRAGLSVVWGRIQSGSAPNAIPEAGLLEGTLRCLDPVVWEDAPDLVRALVADIAAPFGVRAAIDYERGVPPVVNDARVSELLVRAGHAALGPDAVVDTEQSLGGEDFAWFLRHVPGAMVRLGVARPDATALHDLHQGTFDVDERAISAGTRLFVAAALLA